MKITQACLIEALQDESNAMVRYGQFSKIAEQEGFVNVAYLFKSLVETEQIHQKNHLSALGDVEFNQVDATWPVGDTAANLHHAIENETQEYKKGYPGLIKQIRKEGKGEYQKVAALSMKWSCEAEKSHAQVLVMALKAVKSGRDLNADKIYVCKVCGNLIIDEKDLKSVCFICGHDPLFYELIQRG